MLVVYSKELQSRFEGVRVSALDDEDTWGNFWERKITPFSPWAPIHDKEARPIHVVIKFDIRSEQTVASDGRTKLVE